MTIHYAPSNGGFYHSEIHGDAIPVGAVEITEELYQSLLEGQAAGNTIVFGVDGLPALQALPTQEMQILTTVVQEYIDVPAKEWGYDDAKSAVTYVGDPFMQFHLEGTAIQAFRSTCWQISQQIRADVIAALRPIPSVEQLLSELPAPPARP